MKLADNKNITLLKLGLVNMDTPKSIIGPITSTYSSYYQPGGIISLFLYCHNLIPSPTLYKQITNLTVQKEIDFINYYNDLLENPKDLDTIYTSSKVDFNKSSYPVSVEILNKVFKDLKFLYASKWTGKEVDLDNIEFLILDNNDYKIVSPLNKNLGLSLSFIYYQKQLTVKDIPLIKSLIDDKIAYEEYFIYTFEQDLILDNNFFILCTALLYKEIPIRNTQIEYESYVSFLDKLLNSEINLNNKVKKVLADNIKFCQEELTQGNRNYECINYILYNVINKFDLNLYFTKKELENFKELQQ